ncbi:MAG: hypothetical protein GEU99_01215 [Luteitalea sp.]|nr:hypothetical protein [Luteitalea sp.]
MPLKEYREKRDFKRSPEPRGEERPGARRRTKGRTRFFCVQKHLATQLHYDFRLEHNGVLLSWAVPKGPSLDSSVKRLAMHVEDHPIDYGTFEGVIPEGYGAGIVMLWDHGTWEPQVDDIDAAIEKGDLKFTLDGYKLKGSWVLVRTRGTPGGGGAGGPAPSQSWLLIKHRDDWSGPLDISTFAPNSVKSGGGFRDILSQEAPDVWLSNRGNSSSASIQTLRRLIERVEKLEPLTEPEEATEKQTPGTTRSARTSTPQRKARKP